MIMADLDGFYIFIVRAKAHDVIHPNHRPEGRSFSIRRNIMQTGEVLQN